MAAIEGGSRLQEAVLWEANGYDDHGNPTVASPVAVMLRCNLGRTQSFDSKGNPIAIDGEAIIDRESVVGSILWLGSIADVPTTPTGLLRVVGYKAVPDIKNRKVQRTASLVRHSDKLPTVV